MNESISYSYNFDFTPLLGLLFGLFMVLSLWWRRRVGMRRQREFDAGERCMACDKKNMQVVGDAATCMECHYKVSLKTVRASAITAKDIV
ncbi:MAG: hypothetical protein JNM17_20565 [Archangium sp.]|nr:hypothetical protein [Archangium sp.]